MKNIAELTIINRPEPTSKMKGRAFVFLLFISFIFTGNAQANLEPTTFTAYTCANTGNGATISIVVNSNGVIQSGMLLSGGSGYIAGQTINVIQNGGINGTFIVNNVGANGVILPGGISVNTGGYSYTAGAVPAADTIMPGQVCTGTDLNGHTCADFGYASGSLACKSDCLGYDFSSCVAGGTTVHVLNSQNQPSCEGTDVQAAINYAVTNNVKNATIVIPPGTCIWGQTVVLGVKNDEGIVTSSTPMTIAGSGEGTTTIIDGETKSEGNQAIINIVASGGSIVSGTPLNSGATMTIVTNGSGAITSATVVDAGSGYSTGNSITVLQDGASGATFRISGVSTTGAITSIGPSGGPVSLTGAPTNAGTGYTTTATALSTSLGGTGYEIGDLFTVLQTGASGGTFIVTGVSSGAVESFTLNTPGSGYTTHNNLLTSRSPYVLQLNTTLGGLFRVTNFTMQGGTVADPQNKGMLSVFGYSQSLRIDHMQFIPIKTAAVEMYDYLYGVIDHSTFDLTANAYALYTHHDLWGNIGQSGDGSWVDTMHLGTEEGIFEENDTFTYANPPMPNGGLTCAHDGWTGDRWIFRYNNVINAHIGNHGTESSHNLRGSRSYEIYDNNVTFTFPWANAISIRSGDGVIFDNTFNNSGHGGFNGIVNLQNYRDYWSFPPWGQCDGASPYDSNSETAGSSTTYDSGSVTSQIDTPVIYPVMTDTSKNWTPDQWIGYSIIDTQNDGGDPLNATAGIITANTSNTITASITSSYGEPWLAWNIGDSYVITKADMCLDQVGRGAGELFTRSASTGSPVTAFWPQQAAEPTYIWNNTYNGENNTGVGFNNGGHVLLNRDFYNNVQAPGYVPYVYPHPLTVVPPTISLKTDQSSYTASANIVLSATAATAAGDSITSVAFYNGAALLGTSTGSPYSYTLSNVAEGNYSFTAIAYDSNGASTTSSVVNVIVNSSSGILYGDVNGDGQVTIADAELVAQETIGLSAPNFNTAAAEVDGTGKVSIYDAYLIAEYAVGIIKKFPVQP